MTDRWDPDHYDDALGFVSAYGADLVTLLGPEPDERILDLGCGTGHLTDEIAESGAAVVGLDRSREMVREARESYDHPFLTGDARALPFHELDAVFSNAALHWIPREDQPAVCESIHDALAPGGRLVCEFGGAGNVRAITEALLSELGERGYDADHPWYFPTVGEHATLLEDTGLEVTFARLFDRPTTLAGESGLRDWIEGFGDRFFTDVPDGVRAEVIRDAEDRLRGELFDGADWTADYRRLRIVAVRKD